MPPTAARAWSGGAAACGIGQPPPQAREEGRGPQQQRGPENRAGAPAGGTLIPPGQQDGGRQSSQDGANDSLWHLAGYDAVQPSDAAPAVQQSRPAADVTAPPFGLARPMPERTQRGAHFNSSGAPFPRPAGGPPNTPEGYSTSKCSRVVASGKNGTTE